MSKKFHFLVLAAVLSAVVLTGCGKESGKSPGAAKTAKTAKSKPQPPPPLDTKRIAEDEKWGIEFSADKKTLVKYNSKLEMVNYTLPDGVEAIGDNAFANSKNLKTVTLPYGVKNIGAGAFAGCRSLNDVTIPSTVTIIGDGAFRGCDMTGVTIPSSVKTIGNKAFFECGNLNNLTIQEGVTTIGAEAFRRCEKLANVTIPSTVTIIGDGAFRGCNMTGVTIPSSVKTIGSEAFKACGKLKTVTIPDGVTAIGNGAFAYCEKLTSVTLPKGIAQISGSMFYECKNLTSVTIPDGVTAIGTGAFASCEKLETLTIPASVTTIGDGAFNSSKNLKDLKLPDGVRSIGKNAFRNCEKLASLTIPAGLTTFDKEAFAGYPGEIKRSSGVKTVEDDEKLGVKFSADKKTLEEYSYCAGGVYVIPPGVTTIGREAFRSSGIRRVIISPSVTTIGDEAFENCRDLNTLTIPSNVKTVGRHAFNGCWELKDVTIQEGVTEIGYGAFEDCRKLERVSIPSSVKVIKDGVFRECQELKNVSMHEGVTTIEDFAFYGCGSLLDMKLPASVTAIGENSFRCPCEEQVKLQFKRLPDVSVGDDEKITVVLPGNIKMELVKVKAGTFAMGRPPQIKRSGPFQDGEPQHQVTLTRDFCIGRTEVTQEQWNSVMDQNPSKFKDHDKLPVERVSWDDAMAFCKKLNDMGLAPAGWKFTLPTEAQWEYAARGGRKSKGFVKYSGSDELWEVAWCNDAGRTHPVAQKRANELGLYDMLGNVSELCLDWYENNYAGDPEFLTGNKGEEHVLRGEAYYTPNPSCNLWERGFYHKYLSIYAVPGFRVVLVPAK